MTPELRVEKRRRRDMRAILEGVGIFANTAILVIWLNWLTGRVRRLEAAQRQGKKP